MKPDELTIQELEQIRRMCEAASEFGINWPLAVSLFPAQSEQERHWKEKMLKGIRIAHLQTRKSPSDV